MTAAAAVEQRRLFGIHSNFKVVGSFLSISPIDLLLRYEKGRRRCCLGGPGQQLYASKG